MPKHPAWDAPYYRIRERLAGHAGKLPVLREGAMRVLDAIQFTEPSLQLDALFLLATVMATTVGLDPHDMVTRARRLIPDAEFFNENMRAAGDYAKGELK